MNTLSKEEKQAVTEAAVCAGEYLEYLGQSDLAKLTSEQWIEFCELFAVNFLNERIRLNRIQGLKDCPF